MCDVKDSCEKQICRGVKAKQGTFWIKSTLKFSPGINLFVDKKSWNYWFEYL